MLRPALPALALFAACAHDPPPEARVATDGVPLVVTACSTRSDPDVEREAFLVDPKRRLYFVATSDEDGAARDALHVVHVAAAGRDADLATSLDEAGATLAALRNGEVTIEAFAIHVDQGRANVAWAGAMASFVVRGPRAFRVTTPHNALEEGRRTGGISSVGLERLDEDTRRRLAETTTRRLGGKADVVAEHFSLGLWPGQALVVLTAAAARVVEDRDIVRADDAAAVLESLKLRLHGEDATVLFIDVGAARAERELPAGCVRSLAL